MKTNSLSVAQIFTTEKSSCIYNVPKYQREYTWGSKEWDLLFNDVVENKIGYFLGSIICINTSTGDRNSDVCYEVIDGQQRITTLSILLLVFYKKLAQYRSTFSEDDDFLEKFLNLKKKLVTKIENFDVPRLTPQEQHYNKDDYYSLLYENKLITVKCEKKSYAPLRKIYKAYAYFDELIDSYINDKLNDKEITQEEIYIEYFNLLDKFLGAIIVSIDVDTTQDAYMLFESLNNRGVPLTSVDLIKNLLIQYSDKDKKSEEVYNTWEKILSYLGEEYSVQERFLRHFYNAFRAELNEPFPKTEGRQKYHLGLLATKTTLISIYEKLIKFDYQTFLNQLLVKAKYYSIIINNANEEDKISELSNSLLKLERIQGAPSYVLLLYLLDKKSELNLEYKHIAEITDCLAKFFLRRNITDIPGTRKLDKIFMNLIESISLLKSHVIIDKIKSELAAVSASDEIFESKLRGPLYSENVDSTRFLLCYYEEKFQTKETYTNLWERSGKDNKYIWTIEHIFPEGENIPQDWIDMIANGDRDLAKQYHEMYVHTLGNLTITGFNSSLSNLSFDKKKNMKDKEGKNIGYLNGLTLNKDIANLKEWHIENIKSRTEAIIDFCVKEFKF